MSQRLTIAYFTSRKEPMLDWFFQSLNQECGGDYTEIDIVVIDFWERDRGFPDWPYNDGNGSLRHVSPKPNVWQGEHRLTKQDWWAASNARNTAVCLAHDGWIAFVDDLSVLMPGWLAAVRRAMTGDQRTITLGAYRKVKNLNVGNGKVISFDDYPQGWDSRWGSGSDAGPVVAAGSWLFGCSLVAPVQAFLDINGWPEAADGLSFEDVLAGIALEKKGYQFRYDRTMLTLESEEHHHFGPVMKRSDYGVSPDDKSHRILKHTREGDGWNANYFGQEGIAGLRRRVLAGEPFPILQIPQHEWFTSTPLQDL